MEHRAKADHWWYRGIQVLFVLAAAIGVWFVLELNSGGIPQLSSLTSTYEIRCNDGRVYEQVTGSELNIYYDDYGNVDQQNKTKLWCSRTDLNSHNIDEALAESECITALDKNGLLPVMCRNTTVGLSLGSDIPTAENYQVSLKTGDYIGTWGDYAGGLIISLIVLVALLVLGRAVFLYVAFKEPLKKNLWIRHSA